MWTVKLSLQYGHRSLKLREREVSAVFGNAEDSGAGKEDALELFERLRAIEVNLAKAAGAKVEEWGTEGAR